MRLLIVIAICCLAISSATGNVVDRFSVTTPSPDDDVDYTDAYVDGDFTEMSSNAMTITVTLMTTPEPATEATKRSRENITHCMTHDEVESENSKRRSEDYDTVEHTNEVT